MLSSNKHELTKAVRRNNTSLQADKADYNSVDAAEDWSALFDCSFRPDHQLSRMNFLEEHSGIIPRLGHDHFVTKSFAIIRPPIVLTSHVLLSELLTAS